jgi:hypothetical protein
LFYYHEKDIDGKGSAATLLCQFPFSGRIWGGFRQEVSRAGPIRIEPEAIRVQVQLSGTPEEYPRDSAWGCVGDDDRCDHDDRHVEDDPHEDHFHFDFDLVSKRHQGGRGSGN